MGERHRPVRGGTGSAETGLAATQLPADIPRGRAALGASLWHLWWVKNKKSASFIVVQGTFGDFVFEVTTRSPERLRAKVALWAGRIDGLVLAVVLLGAAMSLAAPSVGASTSYVSCPNAHPAPRAGGATWRVTHLGVKGLSCSVADAAVETGHFMLTPGGPQFVLQGFRCTSPVGPPQGSELRYYSCRDAQQLLRFTLPGD